MEWGTQVSCWQLVAPAVQKLLGSSLLETWGRCQSWRHQLEAYKIVSKAGRNSVLLAKYLALYIKIILWSPKRIILDILLITFSK